MRLSETDGRLFYVHHSDAMSVDVATTRLLTAWAYEPGKAPVRRTLAEALRKTASQDRDYGQKRLALAAALERLSAESEGRNGDG